MTPRRPAFSRLTTGLDAEYRRLRLLHPEATPILAETFASALTIAGEIIEELEGRNLKNDR